ncbi:MAG: hypothetical protein NVSMB39_1570 [Candidatus Saccharimonadales bacterium]
MYNIQTEIEYESAGPQTARPPLPLAADASHCDASDRAGSPQARAYSGAGPCISASGT